MTGVLSASLGGEPSERFECSRAGCREAAVRALLWRNPKIHGPERRKTWLACEEHLPYLRDFLSARSFPLEESPVEELDGFAADASDISDATVASGGSDREASDD